MNSAQKYLFLLILAATILTIPVLMRYIIGNPLVSGEKPYYELNLANNFQNKLIVKNDFSLIDKYLLFNPYQILLHFLSILINLDIAAIIISSLSMIFALIILIYFLKSFNVYETESFFIVLCFILSPVFISASVFPTYYSFVLFLYLSGLYLFCNKHSIFFQLLTAAIFLLNLSFGIAHSLMILVTVIVLTEVFHEHFKDRRYFYLIFSPLFFIILGCQIFVIFYGSVNLELNASLNKFISDLGSDFGFGIFTLLLSLVGMITIWSYKRKYYILYSLMIAAIIKSFLVNELIIYSSIAISILAGLGFSYFFQRKWEINDLKNVVLLLIFCGLLFSSIAYIKNSVSSNPNNMLVQDLVWIKDNTNKDSLIFSHLSYGFWIEYFANRKVFLDSNIYNAKNYKELSNVSDEIFNSYNLRNLRRIFDAHNITHIIISEDMRHGLVWNIPDYGLDFMKTNKETFKNVHNSLNIEILEVRPEKYNLKD